MSLDIVNLFETLPAESNPRYLPIGGVVYKYSWSEGDHSDDWKADGYRWRNQGAAKKLIKYSTVGITKTFFHVSTVIFY